MSVKSYPLILSYSAQSENPFRFKDSFMPCSSLLMCLHVLSLLLCLPWLQILFPFLFFSLFILYIFPFPLSLPPLPPTFLHPYVLSSLLPSFLPSPLYSFLYVLCPLSSLWNVLSEVRTESIYANAVLSPGWTGSAWSFGIVECQKVLHCGLSVHIRRLIKFCIKHFSKCVTEDSF